MWGCGDVGMWGCRDVGDARRRGEEKRREEMIEENKCEKKRCSYRCMIIVLRLQLFFEFTDEIVHHFVLLVLFHSISLLPLSLCRKE